MSMRITVGFVVRWRNPDTLELEEGNESHLKSITRIPSKAVWGPQSEAAVFATRRMARAAAAWWTMGNIPGGPVILRRTRRAT